jgi:flagellar FliL protein
VRRFLPGAAYLTNQGITVSAPAAAEEVKPAKPKSKKMLMIVGLAVLVLALGGGGAWYFMQKNAHQDEADGEEAPAAAAAHAKAKTPPTFLPLENMVVNLADPGGERMAQIGITIELSDAHAADQVKVYLPAIRSGILMLISQRTSVDLLQREGKEKLAEDIKAEVARPLGFGDDAHAEKPAKKGAGKVKKAAAEANPVQNVLFSSFIVQ